MFENKEMAQQHVRHQQHAWETTAAIEFIGYTLSSSTCDAKAVQEETEQEFERLCQDKTENVVRAASLATLPPSPHGIGR